MSVIMPSTTKSVYIKHFVDAGVPEEEDFEIVESQVDTSSLEDGQVVVQVLYMSVDPYLRGGMKSQGAPKDAGRRLIEGFVSGKVAASKNPKWTVGDFFGANLPFSTLQVISPDSKRMWKLTGLVSEETLSYGVGVLGMPGSTSYAGISGILRPNPDSDHKETIFISAASGAVGSIAGQIAKNVYSLNTIGSAGGVEKVDLLKKSFGYDHAIDYKSLPEGGEREAMVAELKKYAPEGIDMYFENVGGYHFSAAFDSLRAHGRIALCGTISNYNDVNPKFPEVNISSMIYTQQRIEGFLCFPYLAGQKGNFLKDMSAWIKEGKVSSIEETFYEGVEAWPKAFRSLFVGTHKNKGKVVVRI
uniref:Enoyl reductase (ER) domain-containing protein n=1 Tax=Mucochytrium quahogii TaxID=96639 RepID=A0A7S2RJG2_9STRA|mmetsp:Transcript_15993/g.34587  ORF Transcript_15993/g.34587 Transcript_15993/m.34587 type:complete len:359 (+) Transcript_15993:389-1465(+)